MYFVRVVYMCYVDFYFFFNATATSEIYTYCHTLSLHDALPISPGFFQRRQRGHGFILIIKERQHVADNGRGCCHVAAMFKYEGRRIARIVCWRETLKQGMITKFEGQCCIAPDTACPFSPCDTAYPRRSCFPLLPTIRHVPLS